MFPHSFANLSSWCFTSFLSFFITEFPEHSIPTKLTRSNTNRSKRFEFLSQLLLYGVSKSLISSSIIEFPEHSIPNKLNSPNIKILTRFNFLSQFLLHVVSTSFHILPSLNSQKKVSQLNKPVLIYINFFPIFFAIPHTWCFDKISYFLRH